MRLDQHAIKIQDAQELPERGTLAGFVGVVSLLGPDDAKGPGVHRDMGDKAVVAVLRLDRRAPQGLAITHTS